MKTFTIKLGVTPFSPTKNKKQKTRVRVDKTALIMELWVMYIAENKGDQQGT